MKFRLPWLFVVLEQVVLCLFTASVWAKDSDLAEQFKLARRNHITVVDARGAVDSTGQRNHSGPLWVTNVLPGAPESAGKHDLELNGRSKQPKIFVIFVHGYGTPPASALEDSNALWQYIRESNGALRKTLKYLPETDSLAFLAFLWRGDFGRLAFSKSRQAADDTAPSFADFLATVVREAKGARLVILTHSLGAEVVLEALEALRHTNGHPVVDTLILVQGAVPFYSLYNWTVKIGVLNPSDAVTRPDYIKQCSGKYATAIELASQVIFTVSAKDLVLGRAYYYYNELIGPPTAPCDLPIFHGVDDRVTALGSPIDTGDRSELIESPKMPEPIHRPQPQAPVIQILPPPNSLWITFTDMKIKYPHVSPVPIAAYEDTSTDVLGETFPGHSVLFQRNGRKIVQELWNRIAERIGETGK